MILDRRPSIAGGFLVIRLLGRISALVGVGHLVSCRYCSEPQSQLSLEQGKTVTGSGLGKDAMTSVDRLNVAGECAGGSGNCIHRRRGNVLRKALM